VARLRRATKNWDFIFFPIPNPMVLNIFASLLLSFQADKIGWAIVFLAASSWYSINCSAIHQFLRFNSIQKRYGYSQF
jgi:hypothetical protein